MQLIRFFSALSLLIAAQGSPHHSLRVPRGGAGWFGGKDEDRKWSSMLDVDPSKITSTMMKHGGLLMPESSKKDLEVFAKVCKADKVRLNVVQRKLEVTNFVVQLPGEEEALRIGRVYLSWDSYLKPCIEIAVDDVTLLVEFFNVILTKTNWDQLKKNGFPPTLPDETESRREKSSSTSSSFVRIGSIDLSGNVIARLKSRPLKQELAEVKFSLDTFDPLDDKIKTQSLENLANTGRRGCTTDELYALIQIYIGSILKQIMADTLEDFSSTGGSKTFGQVDNVVKLTKKSVSKYINDTGEWSGSQLQEQISERFKKWGIAANEVQSKQAVSYLSKRLQNSEAFKNLRSSLPFFNAKTEDEMARTDNSEN